MRKLRSWWRRQVRTAADRRSRLFAPLLGGSETLLRSPGARRAIDAVVSAEREALLARERESLDALLRMAEALVEGGDDEGDASARAASVATRLAHLACSMLGCRRLTITATVPGTRATAPLAAFGLSPEEDRLWRSGLPGTSLRELLDEIELLRLGREGILVVEAGARALPYGARSVVLALLQAGGDTVGVLTLDHGGTAHRYTPGEIALTRAVAQMAALVIERERLQRERAEAQVRALALQEANRGMDAFLALASHELKTPLTSVSGNIQIAQRRLRRAAEAGIPPASGEIEPLLERARSGLTRMNRLVDDLLDMARTQAERLELRQEPYDLVAVIRDAVDEARALDPRRSLRLSLPEAALLVVGDAERTGQVMLNYLTNALKYAPPDRPIEVGVAVEAGWVRAWTRDQGPGLGPGDRERVWERFYRVENAASTGSGPAGLGLGLYISRSIVERQGGRVGLDTAPGAGSTFWFSLPLADDRTQTP